MSKNVIKLYEKLDSIKNELFRSASDLDGVMNQLRYCLESEKDNKDYKREVIRCLGEYRKAKCNANEWDKLPKLEEDIWNELINEI